MEIRMSPKCRSIYAAVCLLCCLIFSPRLSSASAQKSAIDRGIHEKLVEPSLPEKQLRSAEKFWEETNRFILIGNLQAYGSYSALEGHDMWGGSFYGIVAPAYKLTDRSIFILMYDGQYDRREDLYSDDYGYRKRTEFQRHAITPMLRVDFGENARYSITPSFNYTRTWNKDEGDDDKWNSGLYNYQDAGGGLDFDMRDLYGPYGTLKVGVQYYKRRYPNYDSLLDLATGNDVEKDEKDYHGIITRMEYSWIKDAGFSWMSEYSLLFKHLIDKKVVQSNGILDPSEKQEDYVHEFNVRLWYSFEEMKGGLRLGLDLNGRIYDSNQNYVEFDSPTPGNFEVNTDFFDYRSYRISPNIEYTFELIPLTAHFACSYEKVKYTDRWAKNSDGTFSYDHQWESTYQTILGFKFDLSEKLSLLSQWEHLEARSNNDDESVYVYDYRSNRFLVGAKYEF